MTRRSAGRVLLGAVLAALLLAVGMIPSFAMARNGTGFSGPFPGTLVRTYAAHTSRQLQPIPAPTQRTSASAPRDTVPPTATIDVTYHNFSARAKAAFQAAVNVWQTQIVSTKVIHINASWTGLGSTSGILGEAGPTSFYLGADNFMYPAALAEARCSCNLKHGAEIQAEFNSEFPFWYTGTDGNVPTNRWDLETVVLHELGHGLGFMSSFDIVGNKGYWGYGQGSANHPLRFDVLEYTTKTGDTTMTSFGSGTTALRNQLIDGGVYIGGDNVTAALGGRARLYAPKPWQEGSSNSHFDERTYPAGTVNALMTPVLNNGEAIHVPGAAVLAVFRDIGWTTAETPPPPAP